MKLLGLQQTSLTGVTSSPCVLLTDETSFTSPYPLSFPLHLHFILQYPLYIHSIF